MLRANHSTSAPSASQRRPSSTNSGIAPDESTPIFASPRNFGTTPTSLHTHEETSPDRRGSAEDASGAANGAASGEVNGAASGEVNGDAEQGIYYNGEQQRNADADVSPSGYGSASASGVTGKDADPHHHERRRVRRSAPMKRVGGGPPCRRVWQDRSTGPGTSEDNDGGASSIRGGEDDEAAPADAGWWRKLVDKYGSVELDNKGSVARDHLALERTFLAWLRTSLSFASIGIAITQLFRLNTAITDRNGMQPLPDSQQPVTRLRQLGKPLGATFLGIAVVVLLAGWRRYFEAQYWIIRGKFPASRGSVFLVTFVAMALIIVSLVVVVIVDPTQFES